jgi:hypothetical protein
MVDVPDAITENLLLDLFGLAAELLQVVDVLLEILLKELFWVVRDVPLGSRSSAALRLDWLTGSSSEEEASTKKLRLSVIR